jgi:hypothetical protein
MIPGIRAYKLLPWHAPEGAFHLIAFDVTIVSQTANQVIECFFEMVLRHVNPS